MQLPAVQPCPLCDQATPTVDMARHRATVCPEARHRTNGDMPLPVQCTAGGACTLHMVGQPILSSYRFIDFLWTFPYTMTTTPSLACAGPPFRAGTVGRVRRRGRPAARAKAFRAREKQSTCQPKMFNKYNFPTSFKNIFSNVNVYDKGLMKRNSRDYLNSQIFSRTVLKAKLMT